MFELRNEPRTDGTTSPSERARTFLRRFALLFGLGTVGVVALGLASVGQLRAVPGLETLPTPALALLAMVNSALLLAVAVAVGVALAPRVGLRSRLLARFAGAEPPATTLRADFRRGVGVGVAAFLATAALDLAFAPFVRDALAGVPAGAGTVEGLLGSLPVRLLYGGITEELLLRWGLLTLFAWALAPVARRAGLASAPDGDGAGERSRPGAAVMWTAVVASAVLFGVGHLPAAASLAPLTPAWAARTVLLNAVAGVGFGWLYWRHDIEAAMIAHATSHVVLVGVGLAALSV